MGKRPNFAKEVADLLKRRLDPSLLPNPVVVRTARAVLAQALAGEIVELVVVTGLRGGRSAGSAIIPRPDATRLSATTVGMLSLIHHEACQRWVSPPPNPESPEDD